MKSLKATLEIEKFSLRDEVITASTETGGDGGDPDQGGWDM